jgi:hypothetical protein
MVIQSICINFLALMEFTQSFVKFVWLVHCTLTGDPLYSKGGAQIQSDHLIPKTMQFEIILMVQSD